MANVSELDRVAEFLAQKRIAVVGVAHAGDNTGTFIHHKFRDKGYQVFGVNTRGGMVDGAPLYPRVSDIPGGVDAVVVVVKAESALDVIKDCVAAGVRYAWMHDNTLLPGSSTPQAVAYAQAHGMTVVPNGCPMMHLDPDAAHACMHWVLHKVGRLAA